MTVSSTIARVVLAGNGVTVDFPTTGFDFFVASDLVVTLVNTSTLVETLQVLAINYTVSGGGTPVPATGTVSFVQAPQIGEQIVIQRVLPVTQEVDYVPNDSFPAEVNEGALDRLTFLVQQIADTLSRQPTLPINFTGDPPVLPVPVDGQILAGNSTNTGWENKTASQLGGQVGLPVSIADGGTGGSTADNARRTLQIQRTLGPITVNTTARTLLQSETGMYVNCLPETAAGNILISPPTVGSASSNSFMIKRFDDFNPTTGFVINIDTTGNTFPQGNPPALRNKNDAIILWSSNAAGRTWNWEFFPQQYDSNQISDAQFTENIIVNPAMRFDQENGFVARTVSGQYPADQWVVFTNPGATTSTFSAASVTEKTPAGSNQRFRLICTASDASTDAAAALVITQNIEGLDWSPARFGTSVAKSWVLRFGFNSNIQGTFHVAVRNQAASRSYIQAFTVSSLQQNVDLLFEMVIPGEPNGVWLDGENIGASITWTFAAGSSNLGTADVWLGANALGASGQTNITETVNATVELFDVGMRLDDGSGQYGDFKLPLYEQDLARCQRFIEVAGGGNIANNPQQAGYFPVAIANAVTWFGPKVSFKVEKSRIPGVTGFFAVNGVQRTATYGNLTRRGIGSITNASGVTWNANDIWSNNFIADARLV